MAISQFVGPILDTGFQAPHYFNGRLLTATDLKAEQDAVKTRQFWLGLARGYGIIEGLEVTAVESNTKININAGFGLNRDGQIIHLANDISLPPVPSPQVAANPPAEET